MAAFLRHGLNDSSIMIGYQVKTKVYRYSVRNGSCTYLCGHGKSVTMATNISLSNSVN